MKMTTFYSKLSTGLLFQRKQEMQAELEADALNHLDEQKLAVITQILKRRGAL